MRNTIGTKRLCALNIIKKHTKRSAEQEMKAAVSNINININIRTQARRIDLLYDVYEGGQVHVVQLGQGLCQLSLPLLRQTVRLHVQYRNMRTATQS